MSEVYMVWTEAEDRIAEQHGIFADKAEAIESAKDHEGAWVERYTLPFRDGDVTEEVWPEGTK